MRPHLESMLPATTTPCQFVRVEMRQRAALRSCPIGRPQIDNYRQKLTHFHLSSKLTSSFSLFLLLRKDCPNSTTALCGSRQENGANKRAEQRQGREPRCCQKGNQQGKPSQNPGLLTKYPQR
eukprot:scpid18090/ scgid17142/ 